MRDAHLSIWAVIAGAGLIWRNSGLHSLCQPCCLQIHLAPLPAPSTRQTQICCQEVYHKGIYICCVQQLPELRPILPLSGMCGLQNKTLVMCSQEFPIQLCKLAQLQLQQMRQTRHTQQDTGCCDAVNQTWSYRWASSRRFCQVEVIACVACWHSSQQDCSCLARTLVSCALRPPATSSAFTLMHSLQYHQARLCMSCNNM